MNRNKPTIYDVAKKAGVSANTVSRAINGKSGVGEKTRDRIADIVREIGYHPHIGARALRGTRAGCIGVIISARSEDVPISNPFVMWMFTELYRVFGRHGERICFDMNPYANASDTDYARSIWDKLFSACVIISPLATDDTTIHQIHRSGIPYLSLGRVDTLPECSCATVDYELGAYQSTKYLIDRGHTSIAMLKAFSGFQPSLDRRRGYSRALAEAGIEPDERLIQSVNFTTTNNANIVHRLLVDTEVTALVDCSATEDAASLREGAWRAGRVPGQDFEVVVWTYSNERAVLPEATAHLFLPVRESAAEGLELLAEWYNGKREGPIDIQYAPTLFESMPNVEISPPERLFGELR